MMNNQHQFEKVEAKVEAGERLTVEDARLLYDSETDLHEVGRLADLVRRRMHGDIVYYNVNIHLNPTNVCHWRCPLCAFSRDPGDPGAYVLAQDHLLERCDEAVREGCTEIHIVGGLHPDHDYSWYRNILHSLKTAYPNVHLKAWTAAEIAYFAELERTSVEDVLRDMVDAGLGSLPGGGAEIFASRVRKRIAPRKIDATAWLDVHRTAHALGLRSNATMLFGHLETIDERIDHMDRLRTLQDEAGGFQAFVPLAFHPESSPLASESEETLHLTSPADRLRTIAVSRLMLDNFPHIKAYWVSLGLETAQIALGYGADDFDGTVRHERIHHEAGGRTPTALTVEQLRNRILETGRRPVERDTLYRPVDAGR
jgi:aminodeoxyfutalosine synthase